MSDKMKKSMRHEFVLMRIIRAAFAFLFCFGRHK